MISHEGETGVKGSVLDVYEILRLFGRDEKSQTREDVRGNICPVH